MQSSTHLNLIIRIKLSLLNNDLERSNSRVINLTKKVRKVVHWRAIPVFDFHHFYFRTGTGARPLLNKTITSERPKQTGEEGWKHTLVHCLAIVAGIQ